MLFLSSHCTEKGRNEQILAEEYGKRRQLEAELEKATAIHKTASEKNSRSREAMNVAEMKVEQTQAQVKLYDYRIIVSVCYFI